MFNNPSLTRTFLDGLKEHQAQPSLGEPALPPIGALFQWFVAHVADDIDEIRREILTLRDDRPPT